MNNGDATRELIHVLRSYDDQSIKSLKRAVQSVSNLSLDTTLLDQLTRSGVCSPLIQLLRGGPETVRGDVSLCLYQLHLQSIRRRHLFETSSVAVLNHATSKTSTAAPGPMTISSFTSSESVMRASLLPLLQLLCPPSSSSSHQTIQQQETALEALLRYSVRNLHLTNALVREDAVSYLVPLLFSGGPLL